MNNEEKLEKIKDSLIDCLTNAVYWYGQEYNLDMITEEKNIALKSYEAEIYTFQLLIQEYYPELDLKPIVKESLLKSKSKYFNNNEVIENFLKNFK